MKGFRITISWRIAFGFGLFIAAVGVVFLLTDRTLKQSREINRQINEVYTPALREIEDLNNQRIRAEMLLQHWAFNQTREDQAEKIELIRLSTHVIPEGVTKLKQMADKWDQKEREILNEIVDDMASLCEVIFEVRFILSKFEDYEDPIKRLEAEFYFEQGEAVQKLSYDLDYNFGQLISIQSNQMDAISTEMLLSFNRLEYYVRTISLAVILFGVLITFFTIRSVLPPINRLKRVLHDMAKGVFPTDNLPAHNTEVGDMAIALNRVIDGMKRTEEFSRLVGDGNFDADYEPLSDKDELGHGLIRMRDNLARHERELEGKVIERTEEVVRQKEEIERQRERVTELYTDLTDSINYARRLQQTILPTREQIRSIFPGSFVLFKPKDIVSGDFYWFKAAGNKVIFAAVDCTGHGVPGSFMSLLGYNVLSQVCKVFTTPSSILNNVNRLSAEALHSEFAEAKEVNDGMDMAICTLDRTNLVMEFSGAKNPAIIVRDGEMIMLKPDKFSIGEKVSPSFTNVTVQMVPGDCVYLFSDGYADQFGGERKKKLMKKNFFALLLECAPLPMEAQKEKLEDFMEEWKRGLEQVDDILVIGIRI